MQGRLTLTTPTEGSYHLSICALNGRSLVDRRVTLSRGTTVIDLAAGDHAFGGLARGMAIVSITGPAGKLVSRESVR